MDRMGKHTSWSNCFHLSMMRIAVAENNRHVRPRGGSEIVNINESIELRMILSAGLVKFPLLNGGVCNG
jgi:hypothetical protein